MASAKMARLVSDLGVNTAHTAVVPSESVGGGVLDGFAFRCGLQFIPRLNSDFTGVPRGDDDAAVLEWRFLGRRGCWLLFVSPCAECRLPLLEYSPRARYHRIRNGRSVTAQTVEARPLLA